MRNAGSTACFSRIALPGAVEASGVKACAVRFKCECRDDVRLLVVAMNRNQLRGVPQNQLAAFGCGYEHCAIG